MKARLLALFLSISLHGFLLQIPMQSDRSPLETMGHGRIIPIQITHRAPTPQTLVPMPAIQERSDVETKSQEAPPIPKPRPSNQETKVVALKPRPSPIGRQKASAPPSQEPLRHSKLPKAAKVIGQITEKTEQQQSGPVSLSFRDLKGGYQVMPVYPIAARRERREGAVLLKVEILKTGLIGELTVERSSKSPDLDAAAIDAVRQWRFEPALRNGLPVQQITLLPIRFDLRSN